MFWTESLMQRTLFGDPEYQSSSTVSQLIRFAQEAFPQCDCNFHRHVAFLTHQSTQQFLRPLVVCGYGSLDAAKVPTLNWLESIGSLETFARSTRASENNGKPASLVKLSTPEWYRRYHATDHYKQVKCQAEQFWQSYMGDLHCSVNARHQYEVLHHSDYARMGEADEFRYLVPLCNDCHASVSARGPRVPAAIPEGVKRWL
jgi:hypothetical protein